jgi:integrase
MGTIVYRKGRSKPWLAQIKHRGQPAYSRAFELKETAERWEREEERKWDARGLPATIRELEKTTVADLVTKYLEEVSPTKAGYPVEKLVLNKFLMRAMAKKSIAHISTKDGASYRNERLRETVRDKPIAPSTVRREFNTLQHIFELARTEWGYSDITNPFRGITIKGTWRPRNRRLKDGELERLVKAAHACRSPHGSEIALAILLAAETGMRLQEIFNLCLDDVGLHDGTLFDNRRIVIRKSKTDYMTGKQGRTIVMPWKARAVLVLLGTEWLVKKSGKLELFPMTRNTFKQAWKRIVRRAGITDLTFHDLRHEAASRFDELGLTKAEHDLMMGHANRDMTSRYIHSDLARIQDKLDKPLYDRFRTVSQRQRLGLALRGDEIEEATEQQEEEAIAYMDNVIPFPKGAVPKG